ncbi:iron ABC transporter [Maritimibacter sp. 55A14]|uniref:ATP-binding cassette domain-containing protein n=1 Tax=Maritimibacter sp. 55A14 TaxID=2174844 RepID=UPI000D61B8E8|nr:ATP-binding cassette domain-containing protein [Maritimibacter sp. 55A14]PWE33368.1 iron ABC transporter [Maritimibacter sp. 55A14]
MLEARGISRRLGGAEVLCDVDLAVAPGEVLALAGPNGAGKSSLLACLSGALRPDAGCVRIDGVDPATLSASALARRRAVLEQTPAMAAGFPLEVLVGIAIPADLPPVQAARLVAESIAAMGLTRHRGRPIGQLSGGERHRAHMARALAQLAAGRCLGSGRWLLLDEPTASLDPAHQGAVLRAARAAAHDGAGVLAVLHDLTLAAALADRVALMRLGRIVAAGPPDEVLAPDLLTRVYGLPMQVMRPRGGPLTVVPRYHETQEGEFGCS